MYKNAQWPLTLYFDGACPLCAQRNKTVARQSLTGPASFVDISEDGFDASAVGFSLEAMQSSLHARFSDGDWVMGLDATCGVGAPPVSAFGSPRCHGP